MDKMPLVDILCCTLTMSLLVGLSTGLSCGKQGADIVFALDASYSIWPVHFQKQLQFVVNVVEQFPIGAKQSDFHVAIVTYSENITVHFNLRDFIHKHQLKKAVMRITQYSPGGTYTHKALEYIRRQMFTVRNGGRTYSDKIVVVITDGLSQDPKATRTEAARAHYEGIQIFAIGVGAGVDKHELEMIASSPPRNHVFTVDNYSILNSIKRKVARETCKVPIRRDKPRSDIDPSIVYSNRKSKQIAVERPMRNPPVTSKFPKKRLDVMFLVDDCQFGHKNLHLIKGFIASLTRQMHIGSYWTRVGAFSSQCSQQHNDIYLTEYRTSQDFIADFTKPDTHSLAWLIRRLRHHGFDPANGGRDDAPHIGVLFVDDKLKEPDASILEAKRARFKGVKLFVVAIGKGYAFQEVQQLAYRNMYIRVRDYTYLQRHISDFMDTMLKGV
ncbi:cartilage matrix protein isoform X2 [Octopus bimaculoides]|uniref:cartilage matrix protein isoform X2 n=1 Tax=Octopus bimaculoides TaxID=37653 RepID=UPI0022E042D3|nr:cartilage matrix protein isoform X2 [Octopus bimaculoides]